VGDGEHSRACRRLASPAAGAAAGAARGAASSNVYTGVAAIAWNCTSTLFRICPAVLSSEAPLCAAWDVENGYPRLGARGASWVAT
jgi:hypothetical protein